MEKNNNFSLKNFNQNRESIEMHHAINKILKYLGVLLAEA